MTQRSTPGDSPTPTDPSTTSTTPSPTTPPSPSPSPALEREAAIVEPGFHQFDRGAHVTRWQPEGAEHPVLWSSSLATIGERAAWRGGVPVCAPWFGAGPSGQLRPSHGPARTAPWRRLATNDPLATRHELSVDTDANGQPASLVLSLETRRDADTLDVTLAVTNTGAAEALIEAALHTYLAVSDVTTIEVRGLEAAAYFDKVAQASAPASDAIAFGDLVDRIYDDGVAPVEIVDTGWGRLLRVDRTGATRTVVWNPGPEHAPGDVGEGEWSGFVCVEAAAITEGRGELDGAVTLEPGATHRLGTRITPVVLS